MKPSDEVVSSKAAKLLGYGEGPDSPPDPREKKNLFGALSRRSFQGAVLDKKKKSSENLLMGRRASLMKGRYAGSGDNTPKRRQSIEEIDL